MATRLLQSLNKIQTTMRKVKLYFFLILFIVSPIFAQNRFVNDSLDNYVYEAMKLWNIPGVAVAIVKDGKIIVSRGYGVKEIYKNDLVDENTLFMIASNTKAFTATALCMLEYDKLLSLNDRVVKWLPYFRLYDSIITNYVTINDLLCHRIGLMTFQGDFVNWSSNLSKREIIERLRLLKPIFDFRTTFGYSNAAFLVAGEIIPVVTSYSWEDYIIKTILEPLKMNRTFLSSEIMAKDNNASCGHSAYIDSLIVVPYDKIDNLAPAGSMCSSVGDIARWLLMLTERGKLEGKVIIPEEVIEKTYTPNTIIGLNKSKIFSGIKHIRTYGLGWQVEDYAGRLLVSHTGGVNGFVTSTCFLPEEKLGIAVFTNTDNNYLYEALKYQIIDSYLRMPYRNYSTMFYEFRKEEISQMKEFISKENALAKTLPQPELPLTMYSGTYLNSIYGQIEIKLEENLLNIYFEHHPFLKATLTSRGGNSFLCTYNHPGWGIKVIEFVVQDGKVNSVTIKINDMIDFMPYEFIKKEE